MPHTYNIVHELRQVSVTLFFWKRSMLEDCEVYLPLSIADMPSHISDSGIYGSLERIFVQMR